MFKELKGDMFKELKRNMSKQILGRKTQTVKKSKVNILSLKNTKLGRKNALAGLSNSLKIREKGVRLIKRKLSNLNREKKIE